MLWALVNLTCVRCQLIEVIADRARDVSLCGPGLLHRLGLILTLAAGIGGNGAAINRCRLPANKTKGRTTINDHLEHPAQNIAVREAAMAVLGKGRAVRHQAFKSEMTKPAIGKIEVNLVNQPPF